MEHSGFACYREKLRADFTAVSIRPPGVFVF